MRLCSAIMPTRSRPEYAAKALACFMAQSYQHRELIVIDDDDDPSFCFVSEIPGTYVRYVRLATRLTIPAKLNMACEMAAGDIILRFDDDDYSAPERMADQVKRLEESGKGVTGYCSMLFHDVPSGRAFKYLGTADFNALGTSLAFTRAWWQAHPFRIHPETPLWGEDNLFVADARHAGQFTSVDAGQLMVARVHAGNTAFKDTSKYEYRTVSADAIPRGFFQ